MYLRHQAYTLYYRHVCILVFLHVFAYSILLRCMLNLKRLECGSEDVTQYNHHKELIRKTRDAKGIEYILNVGVIN